MNIASIVVLLPVFACAVVGDEPAPPRVLVFTRTKGFRHDAIPAGIAAVRELGGEAGFAVDATEDASAFTPANLARYRAIVMLNSSGEVFDDRQKEAFQAFIRGGGGLAAVHQGITTLEKWPWYVALVGGVKFAGHPQPQQATCRCESRNHPATRDLPGSWTWTDEWYNFTPNPRPRTHVLMTIDESSYRGGQMGKDHPVSWYHEAEGGRVWCTSLGHTKEGYGQAPLRMHLIGGIRYAAGLAPADTGAAKGGARRLDPQARAFLEKLKTSGAVGFERLPVPEARKSFAGMRELAGAPEAVSKVEDRTLAGGTRARVYTPVGPSPKPALVFFHGGGWVLGSPETIDAPCRRLANASGCVVISVDYGLAPENRFPKPLDECYAATVDVAGHAAAFGVDQRRIAVGGDSAGGNLAAAVALLARDRCGPALAFQLLIYPVTNYAFDTPSYHAFGRDYALTESAMRWFWSQYLACSDDGKNPLASPLRADLRGLPQALVITAELDPLRDEGEAYAARLRAAGVRVDARRYDGQIHGFFQMGAVMDGGKRAIDDAATALRLALGSAPDRAAGRSPDLEACTRYVRVTEETIHGDMDCFRVETPTATYVYGKRGAGFASIIDNRGRDWISYRPGGEARGEYRGLPKCGQPTKFFHCGYGYGQYQTDNPFSSRVTTREAGHARIESETRDGKSACVWDFYKDRATLTLLRIDLPTFWFLYEGAPGGKLDAKKAFVIRPDGRKTTLDQPWSEVVPWVCFGTPETPTGFVCVNHQEPEPGEMDSYVSWPFTKGKDDSFQEVTVFGFGRKGHEKLVKHVADLTRLPARYSIAFVEHADFATAKATCERLRANGQ